MCKNRLELKCWPCAVHGKVGVEAGPCAGVEVGVHVCKDCEGASSHIIREVSLISVANWVPFFILHVEFSSIFKKILNLECVVRPPDKSKEEILEEATTKTIRPSDLRHERIVSYKYVFPVPP
ncbi:hypothetical protein MANES_06G019101v8 [Manihot esculenta]|uniref:Uncharacterized protein n=1 Tax=Manihot esculenta TaxID=3983 RepID=A0ACB7HIF5_MANES|nr:hypothetical protein MANES_06G019101v8 [Manihot esculenta]